jgi:hypothetical protein
VGVGGVGRNRRWRSAIAIVAALSLFGALTTGWAARGSILVTAALTHPVAVSHSAGSLDQAVGHAQPDAPTQKSIKHAWMTHDRPPTWSPLSPESVRLSLPASFTDSGIRAAQSVAARAAPADRDTLTRLCIARR